MTAEAQRRYCRCGTRLARDNRSALCASCQTSVREMHLGVPVVPAEFWLTDRMRDAFTERHMGGIIYAYRAHPYHGKLLPQEAVARWAGISQTQLSRIESGRPLQDLGRLTHWARTLRIPQRLLWFRIAARVETVERTAQGNSMATREVAVTRRREFMSIGGYAIGGHVLDRLGREIDMMHIALDRGTTSEERVAHFEGMAEDLGVQIVRVPWLTVLEPALTNLHAVRGLLEDRSLRNIKSA
jgi:transcriptional regulator with XRE-family HTH domain